MVLGALAVFAVPAQGGFRQREVHGEQERNSPDGASFLVVDPGGNPLPMADVRFAVEDERPRVIRDGFGGRRPHFLSFPTAPLSSSVDHLLEEQPLVHPDASGMVRVRWPRARALLVSARYRDLWAYRWFPRDWRETAGRGHPADQPLPIELVPDWSLTVVVVDETGRPLETMPVRWRCGDQQCDSAVTGLPGRPPDGVVFEHLGYDLRYASEPLVVGIAGILSPPVQETLDPHRAPPGPIVLRMPPTGSVQVQVLECDGQPRRGSFLVELRFAPDQMAESSRRFEVFGPQPRVGQPTSSGSVTFDGVSLGREIDVFVDGRTQAKTRIRGPSSAGETVSVSIRIEPETPDGAEQDESVVGATQVPEQGSPGSLQGFVLLDPSIPPDGIVVRLRWPADRPALERWELGGRVERDGKFSFTELPVGPARLEICSRSTQFMPLPERPVLFQADLELAPGANEDPRLACIDLRGKVFKHEIRLTGLVPDIAFHARVFFGPARRWTPAHGYEHFWQPPLVLVTPWESIDVDLFAPGYRSISLHDLGERAEASLEPGIPVKLRLNTDGILPQPPRYLKAVLVPAEDPHIGIDWEGPAFGATRELSTLAWKPGRMKVTWIVAEYSEDGNNGGGVAPEVSPTRYVEVLDSDQEQVFEVSLSAAELARLLGEFD